MSQPGPQDTTHTAQPAAAQTGNQANIDKAKAFAEKYGLVDKLKKFVKKKLGTGGSH
ncbi:Protein of unknown function [Pyronema omphalodes CBS 100304]|uniref:Uncharacterized protein n=1 Tax=Pyronema omphalodes (strain CBS 100304) TaxID=1076935 RepID=U4KZ75_PYROM|nr:Protein of unknown function [Pyronema omphalodes CBS 100304]